VVRCYRHAGDIAAARLQQPGRPASVVLFFPCGIVGAINRVCGRWSWPAFDQLRAAVLPAAPDEQARP
jgi:hypothetical protein